ncbi:preprotein translocase subunit SecE [Patescibacteria group bacterium]
MNFKNIPVKIITFLKEVRIEMKKVNWPTKQETLRYTLIVVGISVAVAAFLGTLDFIFTILLNKFVF